ncbi:MAG: hypothetical protein EDM74_00355 [Armatimonadetes bacterium]|nr:MAG: hypothetical protein EDM74_00355 [Armatimonadota bacterium]
MALAFTLAACLLGGTPAVTQVKSSSAKPPIQSSWFLASPGKTKAQIEATFGKPKKAYPNYAEYRYAGKAVGIASDVSFYFKKPDGTASADGYVAYVGYVYQQNSADWKAALRIAKVETDGLSVEKTEQKNARKRFTLKGSSIKSGWILEVEGDKYVTSVRYYNKNLFR